MTGPVSDDPTAMQVTWVTKEDVASRVLFGAGNLNGTVTGTATPFSSGTRDQVIHRATMSGLSPGQTYGEVTEVRFKSHMW